jgi:hypothetical protein
VKVVHVKRAPYDLYVGRPAKEVPHHYGNPFSNRAGTKAAIVVDDPVSEFRHWLHGIAHQDLEPERRRWIVRTLPTLAGKVLGCWCVTPEHPDAPCHGTVLAEFARWLEGCTPDEAWDLVDGWKRSQPAPARATDRTNAHGRCSIDVDGVRTHIICTLGSNLEESQRLAGRLQEIRNGRG